MNYRHIYHAGNFADVFKHVVLVALLQALQRKDAAFCYLDTHAGLGRYDLKSREAQKTKEFVLGIEQIIKQSAIPIAEVKTYLNAVKSLGPHFYPGSPRIARYLLRPQDRIILSELHTEDAAQLKREFLRDKQVAVHQQDGYLALKAFLPPKEKRGLVLLDPGYEQTNEIQQIYQGLKEALKRWETGVYAIWYPLKDKNFAQNLRNKLVQLGTKEILFTELSIYPEDSPISLNGSGMAILNPPWQLKTRLKIILPWLWQALSPNKQGCYRIF
jgi:23S rRNA (adenine2030-N6)-methyltransferase